MPIDLIKPLEHPHRHSERVRSRRGAARRPMRLRGPITESAPSRRTVQREALYRRSLALADLLGVTLAAGSVVLWSSAEFHLAALAALPLIVFLAKLAGLYERDELVLSKSTLDEAPRIAEITGLVALVTWIVEDGVLGSYVTGGHTIWLWASAAALTLAARMVARRVAAALAPVERCLVIGERAACEHVRRKVDESRAGAKIVAAIEIDQPSTRDRLAELVELRALWRVVKEVDAERVIFAPVNTDAGYTTELVRVAKAIGVQVSVLPRAFEVVGSAVEFDNVDGMTMLGVRRFGLSRSSRAIKRGFDLLGGVLATALAAPLLAAIVLAIKLDSRGPVFFRQVRVGRDGRHFRIFKFRTMVPDAEGLKAALRGRNEVSGGMFKIAADPRVTRVGRFLRSSSLDELPQLFNVLRGEMSLVGPRPLVVDEDDKVEGLDRSRLHLTPGMTGHWQVLGSGRIPMDEMVGIDYLYVANWSLWQDVKLLLMTVPHVLRRGGV